jgi:hypothetical protein
MQNSVPADTFKFFCLNGSVWGKSAREAYNFLFGIINILPALKKFAGAGYVGYKLPRL